MITLHPIWSPQTQQRIYRRVLLAIAYPGRPQDLSDLLGPGHGAEPAVLAVLATLADATTTVADPDGLLTPDQRRLLDAPEGRPEDSDFVICDGGARAPADWSPRVGEIYRPELGCTVLLVVAHVGGGAFHVELTGPGVRTRERVAFDGLEPSWICARGGWTSGFPAGVDVIVCDGSGIVGIPRTSVVDVCSGGG